jgi:hypothetical protein
MDLADEVSLILDGYGFAGQVTVTPAPQAGDSGRLEIRLAEAPPGDWEGLVTVAVITNRLRDSGFNASLRDDAFVEVQPRPLRRPPSYEYVRQVLAAHGLSSEDVPTEVFHVIRARLPLTTPESRPGQHDYRDPSAVAAAVKGVLPPRRGRLHSPGSRPPEAEDLRMAASRTGATELVRTVNEILTASSLAACVRITPVRDGGRSERLEILLAPPSADTGEEPTLTLAKVTNRLRDGGVNATMSSQLPVVTVLPGPPSRTAPEDQIREMLINRYKDADLVTPDMIELVRASLVLGPAEPRPAGMPRGSRSSAQIAGMSFPAGPITSGSSSTGTAPPTSPADKASRRKTPRRGSRPS